MDHHPSSASGGQKESEVLYINELSASADIENTKSFSLLRKLYYNTAPTKKEIYKTLKSAAVFTKFYDFVVQEIARHKIIIKDELVDIFMTKIKDLRSRYEHDEIGRNREDIYELVFQKNGYKRDNKRVEMAEADFRLAYFAVKKAFFGIKRRNLDEHNKKVDEFVHFRNTMKILLKKVLPTVPLQKLSVEDRMKSIIAALLHDIVELDPQYATSLERDFGTDVAERVKLLSKKDWKEYMTAEEKNQYMQADEPAQKIMMNAAKEKRNLDYFGDLPTLPLPCLLCKLSDRLDNLNTLKGDSLDEIIRKMDETKKYFLIPEIVKLAPRGYGLIQKKYNDLKKEYHL